MKCAICRSGHISPGFATVVMHRGETVVLIKQVPANVCDNCGEYYLDEDVAKKTYTQAQDAAERGAEVEIARFVA